MNLPHTPPPRDDKEAKLLVAAKDSFIELGYAATSMDLVAQRARASKTTLYTRFPSKEALFAAVIVAECEAFGLRFSPEEFADIPVDEALREIARRFMDLFSSDQCVRVEQMVLGEAPRFPEIAQAFQREGPDRVTAAMIGYFADATARGLLSVPDPAFAAQHFIAALKAPAQKTMMLCTAPLTSAADRERFIAATVALFLDGARTRG